MATANERKALWFFALVALSGSGVRLWKPHAVPSPAASRALERQLGRVDSARASRASRAFRAAPQAASARPPRPPVPTPEAPIDLNRATASELDALPGIGPALAQRIVGFRDSAGPFASIEDVCGVRGIGTALAEQLRPLVTFNGTRSPLSVVCGEGSKPSRNARRNRSRQPR
ncbi:MAG: helix-hairpin-helix domain-containing protein [Gemmatimonadaceae bacterium]